MEHYARLFWSFADDVDSDCPSSDASESSLLCQTSFPSVVSLDHAPSGDGGEQKPPALEDGPGMDF